MVPPTKGRFSDLTGIFTLCHLETFTSSNIIVCRDIPNFGTPCNTSIQCTVCRLCL